MGLKTLVSLKEITKRYGSREVLANVSLSISPGESVVVRGSNGSGKSTLLRIAAGLIPLTAGKRTVQQANLVIGYTPDRLSKLPITSLQYLTHMGSIANVPKKELRQRILELHKFFELEPSQSLKMTHFSKGMLQKVNLMQATIKRPELLVLDEPFSGLDKESVQHLIAFLKQMKAEGTAILAAVHDSLLARQLESRIYWLNHGELREESREEQDNLAEVYYELKCFLNPEALEDLTRRFPDLMWRHEAAELISFTVALKDYREVLLNLIQQGVEIDTLQRKETDS